VGAVGDQPKSRGMTFFGAELAPGAMASTTARIAIVPAAQVRRTDGMAKLLSTEHCFGGLPAAAYPAAETI
jgi:hypothetical protein